MKFIILLFFVLSAFGFNSSSPLPDSSLSILRTLISNSIPYTPYQPLPELWIKSYFDVTTVKRADLESVFAKWDHEFNVTFFIFKLPIKIPEEVKAKFRVIAYTLITDFTVFKFNPSVVVYSGQTFFGGAAYDEASDTITMAISLSVQTFWCLFCVGNPNCPFPTCMDKTPDVIVLVTNYMQHYGFINALSIIPPGLNNPLPVDPVIDQLRQTIINMYINSKSIQADMYNQLQHANQITSIQVGKLGWYQSIATGQFIRGVSDKYIDAYLDYLVKTLLNIPAGKVQDDAFTTLGMIAFSNDGKWQYQTLIYTDTPGHGTFCWVGGYHDNNNEITHWIYGTFSAVFTYIPDVYVKECCHKEFFFFNDCDKCEYYLPHPINDYDIAAMNDLFQLSTIQEMYAVLPPA